MKELLEKYGLPEDKLEALIAVLAHAIPFELKEYAKFGGRFVQNHGNELAKRSSMSQIQREIREELIKKLEKKL